MLHFESVSLSLCLQRSSQLGDLFLEVGDGVFRSGTGGDACIGFRHSALLLHHQVLLKQRNAGLLDGKRILQFLRVDGVFLHSVFQVSNGVVTLTLRAFQCIQPFGNSVLQRGDLLFVRGCLSSAIIHLRGHALLQTGDGALECSNVLALRFQCLALGLAQVQRSLQLSDLLSVRCSKFVARRLYVTQLCLQVTDALNLVPYFRLGSVQSSFQVLDFNVSFRGKRLQFQNSCASLLITSKEILQLTFQLLLQTGGGGFDLGVLGLEVGDPALSVLSDLRLLVKTALKDVHLQPQRGDQGSLCIQRRLQIRDLALGLLGELTKMLLLLVEVGAQSLIFTLKIQRALLQLLHLVAELLDFGLEDADNILSGRFLRDTVSLRGSQLRLQLRNLRIFAL
mmetsp:Transcript_47831/g.83754  ORF Transcript_47831/g.83754 Transcript_47831/m.83754 type:complete len:395 (+) Transcript_47831:5794-6978(+)